MKTALSIQRATTLKPKPPENDLGFGRYFSDHMLRVDFSPDQGWHDARIVPYGPLQLDPAAGVLHYAQAVFDGLKAFRSEDGKVRVFRADKHMLRLRKSAERLCMPVPEPDQLSECLLALLRVDQEWVPKKRGTALYARPALIATEPFLGVRPAREYMFFCILSPSGNYYAEGQEPVSIWVEEEHTRAAPGGLGMAKAGANYAASLLAAVEAKKRGYAQVLWLDALEHRYIEEVGTMNLFVRIGDEVLTSPLEGTFLDGVTRDSVLTLLADWKMKATERKISIDELREAHAKKELHEVFGSGTAAVISPVGTLGFQDATLKIGDGRPGELAMRLYDTITGIQQGRLPDRHGWMKPIEG